MIRYNPLIDLACDADEDDKEVLFREVISTGDAHLMRSLVCEVDGVGVDRLSGASVTCGDVPSLVWFAYQVRGADAEQVAEVILDVSGTEVVDDAGDDPITEAVIASGDLQAMIMIAKGRTGDRLERLSELVIDSGDERAMYQFSREVRGGDSERMIEALKALW